MEEKMMIYYDITAWESIPIEDFDELKERCIKICKMLDGLGIMSFKIRTSVEEESPQPEGVKTEQSTN